MILTTNCIECKIELEIPQEMLGSKIICQLCANNQIKKEKKFNKLEKMFPKEGELK